jgi:hypothetical protein
MMFATPSTSRALDNVGGVAWPRALAALRIVVPWFGVPDQSCPANGSAQDGDGSCAVPWCCWC